MCINAFLKALAKNSVGWHDCQLVITVMSAGTEGMPATIVKDGQRWNVQADQLSQGDIVLLQTGDIVPADLQLVETTGLEIDEFEITGELLPVYKQAAGEPVFMGSQVIKGTGAGRVIATGAKAEFGALFQLEISEKTHQPHRLFHIQHFKLAGLLLPAFAFRAARGQPLTELVIIYCLAAVILAVLQNGAWFEFILSAYEQRQLRRKNIHLRDPQALKRLEKIDVLSFDKTGVLTAREMDISKIYLADEILETSREPLTGQVKERTSRMLFMACGLCHDLHFIEKIGQANPIDRALIAFARRNGFDVEEQLSRQARIYEKPFDSEARYMVVGYRTPDQQVNYFAKGDPAVIGKMCHRYMDIQGEIQPTRNAFRRFISKSTDAANQEGDTVIALAWAPGKEDEVPESFIMLGVAQLKNLLQQGAPRVIAEVEKNDIRTILLTGDRAKAALQIGQTSGIMRGSLAILTGENISRMELAEVARQAAYCPVFARLLPSQKGTIIRLLQQHGNRVAMVGDGANDGIALKVADVSISFASGSSPIARRLADILINNLGDLVQLIETGCRLARRERYVAALRRLALVGLLVSIYAWALTGQASALFLSSFDLFQ